MNKIMSYEQYLIDVKKGIVTDHGNCPVTPLLFKLPTLKTNIVP